MKIYTAKYYPVVDGKEKEYTTIVEADDKVSAEELIRQAYIEQLYKYKKLIKDFGMFVVGGNVEDIYKNIEYAKSDMRIEII